MCLALYNKLVLKEIFVTPVGYDFLHRLQEYLYTIPYIRREDILPITVYEPEGMVSKEKRSKEEIKQKKKRQKNKEHVVSKNRRKKNRDYQKLFKISTLSSLSHVITKHPNDAKCKNNCEKCTDVKQFLIIPVLLPAVFTDHMLFVFLSFFLLLYFLFASFFF